MSFRSHTISHTRRPSSLLRRLARPRSYKEAWVAGDSQTPWYLRPSPRHATAAALSSPVHCTWASIVPTAVPPHVTRTLVATASLARAAFGEIGLGKFATASSCFSCNPQVKHTERGPSRPCCKLVDESSRGRARPRNGSEGFYTPYIMYSTSPCTRPIAWACRKSCSLFVVRTHHTGLSYCTSGFTVRVMSTTVYAFELHTHVQSNGAVRRQVQFPGPSKGGVPDQPITLCQDNAVAERA